MVSCSWQRKYHGLTLHWLDIQNLKLIRVEKSLWPVERLMLSVTGWKKGFFRLSMTMPLLCSGIKTISTPFKINFILKNYSLISKDLWSSLPGPPEDKSQVIGLSWTPGICNSSRYSIVEETGALASIVVSYKYNQ